MNRSKLKQFDVIHAHLNDGLILGLVIRLLFPYIKNRKRPRLVFTCHMVGMAVPKVSLFINALGIQIFDRFALMALDNFWRKRIDKNGSSKVSVISNGIDTSARENSVSNQANHSSDGGAYRIGTLSRLEPERSPLIFVDLFALIQRSSKDLNLRYIVGGDGSMKAALQKYADFNQITDYIDFEGLIIDSTAFLNDIDIYVSLNIGNQTGIAALEAVFLRIPVVGIQLDKKYIASNSDFIWSSSDLMDVSKRVIQLSANKTLRDEVQSHQLKFAQKKYTAQVMGLNYLEIYNSVG
jgi:glycosyltransferase involved in cell wall biosynthesis